MWQVGRIFIHQVIPTAARFRQHGIGPPALLRTPRRPRAAAVEAAPGVQTHEFPAAGGTQTMEVSWAVATKFFGKVAIPT